MTFTTLFANLPLCIKTNSGYIRTFLNQALIYQALIFLVATTDTHSTNHSINDYCRNFFRSPTLAVKKSTLETLENNIGTEPS